ncbi:MAG TPA: NIL domain-containing protein [bacterium]|jgi:ABC-type methionine transport system ATPase subunit|nr:NIL domain-containing protein [bacterium]
MAAIKKLVELDYPTALVTEPVLSKAIKKYDITVNIRRASITKGFGYVQMEIEGEEPEIKRALDDFSKQGIDVNPIVKNIVE